jgi:hypothetical protein
VGLRAAIAVHMIPDPSSNEEGGFVLNPGHMKPPPGDRRFSVNSRNTFFAG